MNLYNLFIVLLMIAICLVIPYFTVKSLLKKDWCLSKIFSLFFAIIIGLVWLLGFFGFGNLRERDLDELAYVKGIGKINNNKFIFHDNGEYNEKKDKEMQFVGGYSLELLDSEGGRHSNIVTRLKDIPMNNIELWYYEDGFGGFHHRYVYQLAINEQIIYPLSLANQNVGKKASYMESRIVVYVNCLLRIMLAYLFLWNILVGYFRERKK